MSSVETLADKLGGEDAVTVAVDDFYKRLVGDETLKKFFEGVDMDSLKNHQVKFMMIAFTKIPDDLDVGKYIAEKHERLFAIGVNETHFDSVAGHFVATLQGLQVSQNLIDQAVGVIGPLRPVFEAGAKAAQA